MKISGVNPLLRVCETRLRAIIEDDFKCRVARLGALKFRRFHQAKHVLCPFFESVRNEDESLLVYGKGTKFDLDFFGDCHCGLLDSELGKRFDVANPLAGDAVVVRLNREQAASLRVGDLFSV